MIVQAHAVSQKAKYKLDFYVEEILPDPDSQGILPAAFKSRELDCQPHAPTHVYVANKEGEISVRKTHTHTSEAGFGLYERCLKDKKSKCYKAVFRPLGSTRIFSSSPLLRSWPL